MTYRQRMISVCFPAQQKWLMMIVSLRREVKNAIYNGIRRLFQQAHCPYFPNYPLFKDYLGIFLFFKNSFTEATSGRGSIRESPILMKQRTRSTQSFAALLSFHIPGHSFQAGQNPRWPAVRNGQHQYFDGP